MRRYAILALALAGCAMQKHPYRFGSPMLGSATVPPPPVGERPRHDPMPSEEPLQNAAPVRTASTRVVPVGRTATALAIAKPLPALGQIHADSFIHLPAPHMLSAGEPLPAIHEPADLRELVGRRDKGTPIIAALAWCAELGIPVEGTTGPDLVAHAEAAHRLAPAIGGVAPGDLLVFDHADSDELADLVAIAIDRDRRGVIELIYVGGGVVRRGFVDPNRPGMRRDATGAVVNTFLRWGKRWPPAGTHYLAGELFSHVIRAR